MRSHASNAALTRLIARAANAFKALISSCSEMPTDRNHSTHSSTDLRRERWRALASPSSTLEISRWREAAKKDRRERASR